MGSVENNDRGPSCCGQRGRSGRDRGTVTNWVITDGQGQFRASKIWKYSRLCWCGSIRASKVDVRVRVVCKPRFGNIKISYITYTEWIAKCHMQNCKMQNYNIANCNAASKRTPLYSCRQVHLRALTPNASRRFYSSIQTAACKAHLPISLPQSPGGPGAPCGVNVRHRGTRARRKRALPVAP